VDSKEGLSDPEALVTTLVSEFVVPALEAELAAAATAAREDESSWHIFSKVSAPVYLQK
jgi:hypothetical protein